VHKRLSLVIAPPLCPHAHPHSSIFERQACKKFVGGGKRFNIVHAEWTPGPDSHVRRRAAALQAASSTRSPAGVAALRR
jgi:hypothetical protein